MATKLTKAIEFIETAIRNNVDIFPLLSGNPGIGKTVMLHQMAERNNWGFIPVHIGLLPPEKLSGIPKIEGNDTIWTVPELITQANKLAEIHDVVIIFWDDIHLASADVQKYFFEIASEKKIHGYKLPNNVFFIAAGNPSAKAGKKQFLSPVINRVIVIEVYQDVNDWLEWAMENNIHPVITSYVAANPEHLSTPEDVNPFASPRSWHALSKSLYVFETLTNKSLLEVIGDTTHSGDIINIINGSIGPDVGSKFVEFLRFTMDVNFKEVFEDPNVISQYDVAKRYIVLIRAAELLVKEKKYSKYALRLLDYAYNIAGNRGNIPTFAYTVFSYIRRFSELYGKKDSKKMELFVKLAEFIAGSENANKYFEKPMTVDYTEMRDILRKLIDFQLVQ